MMLFKSLNNNKILADEYNQESEKSMEEDFDINAINFYHKIDPDLNITNQGDFNVEITLDDDDDFLNINEMETLFCKYKVNGCNYSIIYNDRMLDMHEQTCNFKVQKCIFCQEPFLFNKKKEHEDVCSKILLECLSCKKIYSRENVYKCCGGDRPQSNKKNENSFNELKKESKCFEKCEKTKESNLSKKRSVKSNIGYNINGADIWNKTLNNIPAFDNAKKDFEVVITNVTCLKTNKSTSKLQLKVKSNEKDNLIKRKRVRSPNDKPFSDDKTKIIHKDEEESMKSTPKMKQKKSDFETFILKNNKNGNVFEKSSGVSMVSCIDNTKKSKRLKHGESIDLTKDGLQTSAEKKTKNPDETLKLHNIVNVSKSSNLKFESHNNFKERNFPNHFESIEFSNNSSNKRGSGNFENQKKKEFHTHNISDGINKQNCILEAKLPSKNIISSNEIQKSSVFSHIKRDKDFNSENIHSLKNQTIIEPSSKFVLNKKTGNQMEIKKPRNVPVYVSEPEKSNLLRNNHFIQQPIKTKVAYPLEQNNKLYVKKQNNEKNKDDLLYNKSRENNKLSPKCCIKNGKRFNFDVNEINKKLNNGDVNWKINKIKAMNVNPFKLSKKKKQEQDINNFRRFKSYNNHS